MSCLFFDHSHRGVSNTQDDRSPVLFPGGGQEALDGPVDDVHTWEQNTPV